MNGAPLPHKGIPRGPQVPKRPRSAQPAPSGAADKEMQRLNGSASLNLLVPLPKTKAHPGLSRPPRARPLWGAAAPEVLFSMQGARQPGGWGGTREFSPPGAPGSDLRDRGSPPSPWAREVCAPARRALTSPRAVQLVAALCAYWRVHRHQARAARRPTRARRPGAAARRPRPATESPRKAGAGKFRWRMAAGGRCSGGGAGALAACRSRASRLGGLGWERRRRERAGRREGPTRPSDLRWERTRARLPWLGDVPRGSPARRPPQTPGGGTLQLYPPPPRPRRPLPLAPWGGRVPTRQPLPH